MIKTTEDTRLINWLKNFYEDSANRQDELIELIELASSREEDEEGNKRIYNTATNRLNSYTGPFERRIRINWELVIPNPDKGQHLLQECQFKPER